ncbi:protein TIFY 8 [Euphorbia lathyris]|uniref:protein TIFY 8 n=1 Tax=Euphorbia lathyris TaxID=212925 RepID=UPI00331329C6
MVVLRTAEQTKLNNVKPSLINSTQKQKESNAMFHDFLGMKAATADSPVVLVSKNPDASPSSVSASISAGAVRGPPSTTSDIASERQAANHLEGIPFYGPRNDISAPEITNRLLGSKRSNSDSAFTGSTREGILQIGHDSLESLHMMKMLKSGGGAECPGRSNDDDVFYGMQSMRPTSASLILQSSTGGRFDATVSKWDPSIPMGAAMQYPPRVGQFVPFAHQVPSNKFRDMNAGPSVISQSAADEGSRTGIKGPGILSSINAASGNYEKNASGVLPSGTKPRSGIHIPEPESSTPSNPQGSTSASGQMTIFYGGQAHVFDDVHPNKADVIMALAGSNGGSWSTTYSSKPTGRPGGENYMSSGEKETSITAFQRGRLLGSGVHHGSIVIGEEKRKQVQAGETSGEEKREVGFK